MTVYKSAVDWWLAIILIGTPVIVIGKGVLMLREAQPGGMFMAVTGILVAILIGLLAIPCKYTVKEEYLEIRCGLLKEKIELEKIQKLTLSSNARSSPALSLKRVKIQLKNGYRLISPKDREKFIQHIESLILEKGQPVAGGDATR